MSADAAFGRRQLRDLGRQIRALRARRGLSLSQLARQSGVSVTGIRNIEFGRANPGLLTVVAILDVLGVSIDELVGLAKRAGKTVHVTRARAGRAPSLQRGISEIYRPHLRGRVLALLPGTHMVTARKADGGPHFAFVLEGRVRLGGPEAKAYELAAGDAVHFADQPPRVAAGRGARPARLIWIRDTRAAARDEAPSP